MIPEKKQIAILADIHSNFEAFRTCIEEAEKKIYIIIFFWAIILAIWPVLKKLLN